MMTSEEYVKKQGVHCPMCGSRQVFQEDPPQVDGTTVWMDVICHSCDATWTDTFVLSGYTDLEKGED